MNCPKCGENLAFRAHTVDEGLPLGTNDAVYDLVQDCPNGIPVRYHCYSCNYTWDRLIPEAIKDGERKVEP